MNKSLHLRKLLLGLTVAAMSQISIAQQPELNKNYNEEEVKPWEEIQAELPQYPKEENLLPFYVGPTARQKFAIDSMSLSIGKDGVVRYTMVSTSSSGAKNVSYEGIRCASFEKKIYAVGRDDGTWARSRRDEWRPIVRGEANRQHAALSADYFCSNLTVVGSEKDMIYRLKSGKTLTEELIQ